VLNSSKLNASLESQEPQDAEFLSKALTPTEQEYANIERELLAIVFACERLHTYTFGQKVIIHTDHQPLRSIIKKPISLAPPRLQRMLIRLRTYDIDIIYVGANKVLLSDTLSRLVTPGKDAVTIPNLDVKIAQVLKIKPTRLETMQHETKTDPALTSLQELITRGWPQSKQDLPEELHPYWCMRDELSILDGLILKGHRVVVPSSQREDTLRRLHDAHQGVSSTLQRARRTVYWPRLKEDVTDLIEKCDECQMLAKRKPITCERQLQASRAMEIIALDIMEVDRTHFLVGIDFFSGYLMIDRISSLTSNTVISTLIKNFGRFGLCENIISDNGPCFSSEEFARFCKIIDVKHITSSPHYHQSNGRVERAIQTVKQLWKKTKNSIELMHAIIAYHDTPISNSLPSPAELFLNRRINSRLGPLRQSHDILTEEEKEDLAHKRGAHLQPATKQVQLSVGQPVWFYHQKLWHPGFISAADTAPESYWITDQEQQRKLRRNIHDIKPRRQATTDLETRVQDAAAEPHLTPLTPVEPHSEPTEPQPNQQVLEQDAPLATEACDHTDPPPDVPVMSRSGRPVKSTRQNDYVYNLGVLKRGMLQYDHLDLP